MTLDSNPSGPLGLRDFLEAQAAMGAVRIHDEPVDPVYELPRLLHDQPEALIQMERVTGCACRAVGGLVATRGRVAQALGVTQDALIDHMARALAGGLGENGAAAGKGQASPPPAFEAVRVESPDLMKELPAVQFVPQGARRYLSSGIVAGRSGQSGMNYSFHRLMFLGQNRMVARVVPRHLRMILDEGSGKARVAVLLGVHPAMSVAAACSGPPEMDELALAGRLAGRPLGAVELEGLRIPAATEIVLLGRFTGELAEEGPFVDITGTLDGVRQQPVLEVDRLLRREDALCPVILPGGREHRLLMGLPQEPRIWNAVKSATPSASRLLLSTGGCAWLHAVVVLGPGSPAGAARNAGLAALAAHPSLKRVVVVDDDVDPDDPVQVEWAVATRCQPDRDLVVIPGARGSSLDPSRDPSSGLTAKWIVDATMPAGIDPVTFRKAEPPPAGATDGGPSGSS